MELLEKETCKISVSSVLDRNGKEYGKQFLLDGEEDTCWNSDQVRAFEKITMVSEKVFNKQNVKYCFRGFHSTSKYH